MCIGLVVTLLFSKKQCDDTTRGVIERVARRSGCNGGRWWWLMAMREGRKLDSDGCMDLYGCLCIVCWVNFNFARWHMCDSEVEGKNINSSPAHMGIHSVRTGIMERKNFPYRQSPFCRRVCDHWGLTHKLAGAWAQGTGLGR